MFQLWSESLQIQHTFIQGLYRCEVVLVTRSAWVLQGTIGFVGCRACICDLKNTVKFQYSVEILQLPLVLYWFGNVCALTFCSDSFSSNLLEDSFIMTQMKIIPLGLSPTLKCVQLRSWLKQIYVVFLWQEFSNRFFLDVLGYLLIYQ